MTIDNKTGQTDGDRPEPLAWSDLGSYLRFVIPVLLLLPLDLVSKSWAFERFHDRPDDKNSLTLIPGFLEFRTVLNQGALFGIGHGQQWFFVLASILACGFVGYLFATSERRHWRVHIALALVLAGALGNLYDRTYVRLDEVKIKPVGTEAGKTAAATPLRPGVVVKAPDDGDKYLTLASYPRRDAEQRIPVSRIAPNPDGSLYRRVTAVRDFIHIEWTFGSGPPVWPWIFNLADVYLCVGVGILVLNWVADSWRARRQRRAAEALAEEPPPYLGSGD